MIYRITLQKTQPGAPRQHRGSYRARSILTDSLDSVSEAINYAETSAIDPRRPDERVIAVEEVYDPTNLDKYTDEVLDRVFADQDEEPWINDRDLEDTLELILSHLLREKDFEELEGLVIHNRDHIDDPITIEWVNPFYWDNLNRSIELHLNDRRVLTAGLGVHPWRELTRRLVSIVYALL